MTSKSIDAVYVEAKLRLIKKVASDGYLRSTKQRLEQIKIIVDHTLEELEKADVSTEQQITTDTKHMPSRPGSSSTEGDPDM